MKVWIMISSETSRLGLTYAGCVASTNITAALLDFGDSLTQSNGLHGVTGWSSLADDPCSHNGQANVSWTYIKCTNSGDVTGINLTSVVVPPGKHTSV